MFPSVISESLVTPFKYWNKGKISQGVRHGGELYSLIKVFSAQERLQAYAMGCDLSEQGKNICIICSKKSYSIWMSLRSPEGVEEKSMTAFHGDVFRAEPAPNPASSHLSGVKCAA